MAQLNYARMLAERSEEMTYNLLECYERATAEDIAQGEVWYPSNVKGCKVWGKQFDVSPKTVACIIAALSPQANWNDNLRAALAVISGDLTTYRGGVLQRNVSIAQQILRDRATSLDGYFKDGPKVTAFARNLQGDASAVTVDAHAAEAALDSAYAVRLRSNVYPVFASVYRDASRIMGHRPCDFQAIVWHVWKREHPPEAKRAVRRGL
jgi:hypothetical protein